MAKIDKQVLLLVAVARAGLQGYTNITRDDIAHHASVSMGTVTNLLGTMKQIKRAVVRHAIRLEVLAIIAQAVVMKDPLIRKLDPDLKKRALESL